MRGHSEVGEDLSTSVKLLSDVISPLRRHGEVVRFHHVGESDLCSVPRHARDATVWAPTAGGPHRAAVMGEGGIPVS